MQQLLKKERDNVTASTAERQAGEKKEKREKQKASIQRHWQSCKKKKKTILKVCHRQFFGISGKREAREQRRGKARKEEQGSNRGKLEMLDVILNNNPESPVSAAENKGTVVCLAILYLSVHFDLCLAGFIRLAASLQLVDLHSRFVVVV